MAYLKRLYHHAHALLVEYRRLDGLNLAAALSFYTILSLLPILLIVISVAGHFLGESGEFYNKLSNLFVSIIPNLREGFLSNLKSVVDQKETFGTLATLFLFFVAHFLFSNLEKTVNRLFHSRIKRHFLITHLLFLIWLCGLIAILFIPTLFRGFLLIVQHWGTTWDFQLHVPSLIWFSLSSFITFFMVIVLVPTHKVKFKDAFLGGLLFSILLKIVHSLFFIYATYSLSRYNLIYGSLTALILGVIWIFYFSNILLLCVLWVARREKYERDSRAHPKA